MKLKRNLGITLVIVFYLTIHSVSPVVAESGTVTGISKELICQCGCTMVLSNCSHAECASRSAMTALIGQKLDQGESRGQIIQYFVAQYGEQVLSSPPKRGFNLTAWLLPFAALLFGGGVIYVALREWLRRGRESPVTARPGAEESDEEYRHRLEQELEEFTERGFR